MMRDELINKIDIEEDRAIDESARAKYNTVTIYPA